MNPFVRDPDRMIPLVVTASEFGVRPSDFIDGIGGYTAYCFDTAAMLYLAYMKDGEKPIEEVDDAMDFL